MHLLRFNYRKSFHVKLAIMDVRRGGNGHFPQKIEIKNQKFLEVLKSAA